MIATLDGEVYHGARAVALLSRISGTLRPLGIQWIARVIYLQYSAFRPAMPR